MKTAMKVVAGVLGAGLLLLAVRYTIVVAGLRVITNTHQQVQASIQRQTAESLSRIEARQAERKRQTEEAKRARLEEDAARTRAEMESVRAQQAETARKAAAWDKFFKPAKKCDTPPDWDTQVECSNAYIRARREFDAKWPVGLN